MPKFRINHKSKQLNEPSQLSDGVHSLGDSIFDDVTKCALDFKPLSFSPKIAPLVSVVMRAHDNFHITYQCLASLLAASNSVEFEVILVDDTSSNETCHGLSVVSGIQYLRNELISGFLHSSNLGGHHATGKYIVLLNSNTEATVGWLDELLSVFNNFESVGLVGSKLLRPSGVVHEAGGIVWGNGSSMSYGRDGNPNDPRYCYTRQVDYVSGHCMMLPRSLWDEIGGFSEIYSPGHLEDADLAFRIREKGYKTVYASLSLVKYHDGASDEPSNEAQAKKLQEINRKKFKARWKNSFKNLYDDGGDPDLIKDRNVVRRALVLDSEIPKPDFNAGGYAALQEMRLLQALGYKCTFVAKNVTWFSRYTEALQRMGIECICAPFVRNMNEFIERRGDEFDLVYVTRYYIAKETIEHIRQFASKAKVVLMNADLHFLRELRAALYSSSDEGLTIATETREDELTVMRKVDLVLTYTDVEQAVILSHNLASTKVARCPWVSKTITYVAPYRLRSDLAFLGGFQHPPNLEAIQWFVEHVLPGLSSVAPRICLRIYGSNIPRALIDLAQVHPQVVIEGWIADVADVYKSCRVFIAPLQSGAGIKGKVVGALSHGVPCVLSSIAAEGIPIGDQVHVSIADQPDIWIERILKIYNSETVWDTMSANALQFAYTNYGFQKCLRNMQKALSVAGIYTEINNPILVWRKDL